MESSSSSSAQPAAPQAAAQQPISSSSSSTVVEYVSRSDIRRAIHGIVRRLLLQRLAHQRAEASLRNDASSRSSLPLRLNKAQRCRALRQSHLLEDILYRRASSLMEYQNLSTLEDRVFKAGRAVYINAQRREMERESRRRMRTANGCVGGAGNCGSSRRRPAGHEAVGENCLARRALAIQSSSLQVQALVDRANAPVLRRSESV